MTKPIMVIIDEAKWCTGLFVRNDSRCALGWLMETAGLCLVNNGLFMSAAVEQLIQFTPCEWTRRVGAANDTLTGDARKLELTRLFREQGMVLCFVDSSKAKVVEEPAKACSWVNA